MRLNVTHVVFASVCAVAFSTAVVPSAEAHVSRGQSWYWYIGSRPMNSNRELDPLNVVWLRGAITDRMTDEAVKNVVKANWRGRPSKGQMNSDQECLGQNRPFRNYEDGRQRAVFRGDGGGPNSFATNGYQMSTSNRCYSQYHMRFWNDLVHDGITAGHGAQYQWALSGVHRDVARCKRRFPPKVGPTIGACHKVYGRWNTYRNYAVNRAMRALCGRSRWRLYPGADRQFQRGPKFDGYIALVKFTYDGNGSRDCPRGLY